MSQLLSAPLFTALDNNGFPISGAKLRFYEPGTLTLRAVYLDAALTTPAPDPLVSDAAGRFPNIYVDTSLGYRARLLTAGDVLIDDIDPVFAAQTTPASSGQWLDVTDYGATGDGTTDDTAAVQAGIDAALAANATLYFPAGTYMVSEVSITPDTTGSITITGEPGATLKANTADSTILTLGEPSSSANRNSRRTVQNIRIDGADLANVIGIELGDTTSALLYARLTDVYITRCDIAAKTRNVQELICEGLIAFDNRVGFVARSSPTDGGSTVMQWNGCRFQNNQVNFFGLSDSAFPIGGWLFNGCTFQTGFHSGTVFYGQTDGKARLDTISMVNCHYEANSVSGDMSDEITVEGKTFTRSSVRLVGADLSMTNGCELSTTRNLFAVLEEGANLTLEDSRASAGQVVQFDSDSTSRVYLEGRCVVTGSGSGLASWRGFTWIGGSGGVFTGEPTLVASANVPNQYDAVGLFPNAPQAGNQIGATISKFLDRELGLVQRVEYLASVGNSGANRIIIDALPMAFAVGDRGLVTMLVRSDVDTRMTFQLQGAASALTTRTVQLRAGLQRVVMYNNAPAIEASGFDLFIYPADDAGAVIDVTRMMSIKRTAAQGLEDINNVVRFGWYDDMLSPVYGDGIPTSGTWPLGKVIKNRAAGIGDPQGWQKVTQGSDNVLDTDWVALADLGGVGLMTPVLDLLPVAGASGVIGMVLMKGIDWWRGKKRDSAETDAIVGQTYGRLIGDMRADLDRMKADMIARDAQCEKDIAALKAQIAELHESKHAMATIVRALVNRRPVPKNHQAMLDSLLAIDHGPESAP